MKGCISADIITTVGTDVTLYCKYDFGYYGKLPVCWGRGPIPNRGCAKQVIKSDGTSITSRLSERYLLQGDLQDGDVSLTIRRVEEADSGMYGCRVDIPGWFNDHKHQVTLTVVPASWDTAVITEVMNPELTQLTLVDLRPAKTYNLRMFARNSLAPEGPPLDMQLEGLTAHSIRVTWKPPKPELTNGLLRSYTVSYREYDPAHQQWHRLSVESIVLSNLKPSTKYGVLVQAKTNAGIGPASTAPPCSTLDEASWDSTKIVVEFGSSQTNATILEVKPSTYNLRMFARNRLGTSKASNVLTITSKETAPQARAHKRAPAQYAVSYREYDPAHQQWHRLSVSATREVESIVLSNLKPSTKYGVLVQAKTNAGIGPASTAPPCSTLDEASWDSTKIVVEFGSSQTNATILEMKPSTYNLRMFARNRLGTSKASNVLTITTKETGRGLVGPYVTEALTCYMSSLLWGRLGSQLDFHPSVRHLPRGEFPRRKTSIWKTSIVLAAEQSGSLGSVQGIGPDERRCGRQVAGTVEWEEEC
ncbi:unnamed protein product [Tetraodon nigroviridis]|uniref:Chromosome 1 SCAF10151, whole genome shotgun sequence n=1 Tax=Tetraodon nigroviridis TaxID=99883 RepID=Q4T2Y6_TETNG|nr:unnamed protein product [Tetraodon nigroviridis]